MRLLVGLALAHGAPATPLAAQGMLTLTPVSYPAPTGAVRAEGGQLVVPARHGTTDGGDSLTIRFVRLSSRTADPGPPIVYLAGGPGASGIAAGTGARWALFDALRDVADVILLDQRGTGSSGRLPQCTSGQPVPDSLPTQRAEFVSVFTAQVLHCRAFWDSAGVDLRAYNTRDSAWDLEALRQALGAARFDLLAISYGTHLALAALQQHPDSYRRVVLVSPEGLDQTVKMPSSYDGFLRRVQASIDADPVAREAYPDISGMMRRVIARAATDAVRVEVATEAGPVAIRLGGFEIQRMAVDRMAEPDGTARVLAAFAAADRGDWSLLGAWAQRRTREPIFLSPMPLGMDAASGVSEARRARVERERETAVLGDAMGYPVLHASSALEDLDLGAWFRGPARTGHPALLFSADLDGRTFPEDHAEVAASLGRSVLVPIVNGGHNAGLSAPEALRRIREFLAEGSTSAEPIVLAPPVWGGGGPSEGGPDRITPPHAFTGNETPWTPGGCLGPPTPLPR